MREMGNGRRKGEGNGRCAPKICSNKGLNHNQSAIIR
jgi:hypothetical protein